MICGRCEKPIGDEPFEKHIPAAPTGSAPAVYLHKKLCKRAPRQTYPGRARG